MTSQGIKTGRFGKWLYDYCKTNRLPFHVFYDHGRKGLDHNVAVPKGFYGEEIFRKNWLVDTDIIIGSRDDDTILLIEVEERQASPKKILGNIFAIMMCNNFAVKLNQKQKYFKVTENTHLLLACLYNEKGYGKEKIENLQKRIEEIDRFPDGIPSKNISFIWGSNLKQLMNDLENAVTKFLESRRSKG